jgi:hypothetical protein
MKKVMDLFVNKNFVPNIDPTYELNRTAESRSDVRDYLNGAYKHIRPFFPEKDIEKKLQQDYHAMSWQIHLTYLLHKNNFKLQKPKKWPDILITDPEIAIEVTNINSGTGAYAVDEVPFGEAINLPQVDEKIVLRINDKLEEKLGRFSKNTSFKNKPFILAMNMGTVDRANMIFDYSYGARTVFGIGESGWSIPIEPNKGNEKTFIKHKSEAKIADGPTRSMNWFLSAMCPELSAIIWSHHHIANSYSWNGSDCELILNPFANYPVSKTLLPFGTVTWITWNEDQSVYFLNHQKREKIDQPNFGDNLDRK